MDIKVPVKLCYNANTYINNSQNLQENLKENTQLGCELINDDSVEADAEILALVVDSLKKRQVLVSFGRGNRSCRFLQGLLEEWF